MFETRQYQIEQIEKTIDAISTKRKVCVQLPTGGGKTHEFALFAQWYIRNYNKAVLILVDRIELMYQAQRTIKKLTNFDARLITSKSKRFSFNRVYIGMVESTVKRLHLFDDVGLVIIDECHVANFNKVHGLFPTELIIGFTATPKSSSKKEPINKYYDDIIVGPQIKDLIRQGYLSQNITRCPEDIVEASKLTIDKLTGDYKEDQMALEYSRPRHITNIVKQYQKFCKGEKTLVYNVNKEHNKLVNQAFTLCGYNSKHLDSDASDEERVETLKWFKENEDAILNNVGILTRGFDEPTIRNIIPNFCTVSICKWLQVTGRGGRVIDDAFIRSFQHEYPYDLKYKNYFNIIDMGGNAMKGMGDWHNDRDWRYIFNNPDLPGNGGVAPTKVCPNCKGLIHAALSLCPLRTEDGEFCNHEFIRKKVAEEKEQEMVIITKGINIKELIEKNNHKHPYYNFLKMGEDIVNNTFLLHKNPNDTILQKAFLTYYDLCKEWYKQKMAGIDGNIPDISFSEWHIKRARSNFDDLVRKKQQNAIPYDYTDLLETA